MAACSDPEPQQTTALTDDGAASSSGLAAFESLLGVGAVVEATVADVLGPTPVLNDAGAVDYEGRSESADEWTTPNGMPVLVLQDVRYLLGVPGSNGEEAVDAAAQQAASTGRPLDVLAPVGVYSVGDRYEFWLSSAADGGPMTYLAFDDGGDPVPGLGVTDLEGAVARASDVATLDRIQALAQIAGELNAERDGDGRGPLLVALFGPGVSGRSVPATTSPG